MEPDQDRKSTGGIAEPLLLGLPLWRALQAFSGTGLPLPAESLLATQPERYWAELRGQWLLAEDQVNLNCGSLGCSPLPVLRATMEHLLAAERYDAPDYPWFGYEEKPLLRELREQLAVFLGCARDELALTRNATEGNNVVCNGLDLAAGDEVLLTDQEHPSGRCCWEQRAERHGIRLGFVSLPRPPSSIEQIRECFARALTPRTRVMVFSHITTATGLVLPVREICTLARERGIWTHIDGAHAIGQIPVDLHAIGCDSYSTSAHKWLMGPKGTGTLYVREAEAERLWVNTASNGWRNHNWKAYRFSNVGSSNLSVMVGLQAALDFFHAIGPERIYTRVHELARRVRDGLQRYPVWHLNTPAADSFYGGLVSVVPPEEDLPGVVAACRERRIRISGGAGSIRIATGLFTQQQEIDAFFTAVEASLSR